MSAITTHVLDTARGRPAQGVPVALERLDAAIWTPVGSASTDRDGRVRDGLVPAGELRAATYRLRFDTGAWFRAQSLDAFYPEVVVTFRVERPAEHHHVPLLLAPHGYTTYRGT